MHKRKSTPNIQSKAKPAPKNPLAPAVTAEVERLAQGIFDKNFPLLMQATAEQSHHIANSKGGPMMDFFVEILEEGISIQEAIYDETGTPDEADLSMKHIAAFRKVFALGLKSRKRKDTKLVEEAMKGRVRQVAQEPKKDKQKSAAPKRKSSVRRAK